MHYVVLADICIIKRIIMKQVQEKTIVRKIEWFNNESEMILSCDMINGAFTYSTDIVVPGDSLNRILSDLQKQTPELDLNECMKIEQWSEDEVSFIFDFSLNEDINLFYIQPAAEFNFRQIRA